MLSMRGTSPIILLGHSLYPRFAKGLSRLRKAFKETFEDPEFVAKAKKTKLTLNYVSADEINGLVKEILNMSPKTKQGLQFLVRKEKK
jgi:hypothetical protein